MTKTISIYAAQILLGVIVIAAGYAKLTGSGLMVHQFHAIGLGQGFLTIAGTAEIAAGLCLLMPRGGILGALLLTSVMVGALGVTLGHVASSRRGCTGNASHLPRPAINPNHGTDAAMIRIVHPRTEWDI